MYNICDILYKEQSFFVFNIRNIPYILYVYVPLVKMIFRVAWPCEDFRENAACAAFALQESFLNDLPCSTFCASRPPRISLIFRFRIRIHLELNEREGERGKTLARVRKLFEISFRFVCLRLSLSLLLLLVLLLHIIIAQYYY